MSSRSPARPAARPATIARRAVALLAFVTAASAQAQEVRGRTLEAGGAVPVPGVIVMLVDSAGVVAARTLSGSAGDFRLVAPRAGTMRLRALRIGFRPTTSDPLVLAAGATVRHELRLTGGAVRLVETRVTAEQVCSTASTDAASGLDAWLEARKALEASLLTRAQGYVMEVMRFERQREPRTDRVLDEVESEYRGVLDRPFVSAPIARLDSLGYVVVEADGTTYFGPDEQVLLSERFAETHCLRMAPSEDADEVTVAFEPVRERTRPDIRGAIVLHRASGALRRLSYHYVNVAPEVQRAQAGGIISFQPLATGGWIVQRWTLRLPELVRAASLRAGRPYAVPRIGESPNDLVLRAHREVGGEVVEVVRGDSVVWGAPQPPFQGMLRHRGGAPIAGAEVVLPALGRRASTDTAGRFTFPALRQARRLATVRFGLLDSLALPALEVTLDSRAVTSGTLTVPSRSELLAGMCDDSTNAARSTLGFIRGRVGTRTGAPRAGAVVEATMPSPLAALGARAGEVVDRVRTTADASGRFAFCAVPLGRPVRLRVLAPDDDGATADVVVPTDARLALAALVVGGARPPASP